jgi:hypothetical protein
MITVIFEEGRNGGVMTRFEGKVSFPEKNGPQPQAGEEWEVLNVSSNPKGTVNFLKLGKKIPEQWEVVKVVECRVKWDATRVDDTRYTTAFWKIAEKLEECEDDDRVECEIIKKKGEMWGGEKARVIRVIKKGEFKVDKEALKRAWDEEAAKKKEVGSHGLGTFDSFWSD